MKKTLLLFCLILFSLPSFSQSDYSVSGYIRDANNGEGMIGLSIYIKELKTGVQTNAYGFYSLTLPEGEYTFVLSYIGYENLEKNVSLHESQTVNLEMKETLEVLDEVVVKAEREDENVKSLEMSVNKVDMKTIRKMPAFMGEVDVIRSIQFLPGVSSVGEGASGFNVRGGGIDQNLILLDEAPVYNSSHLFGLFSVFNPDAVKDVKLIKGGIPANYGGRISSILDVRMKEGNSKKPEFTAGLGTIFSRFAYERPIFKEKGSFIVALRRSYIDVLAKPFLNDDLKESKFYFYDFTAKANYKVNEKNTVFLSGYFGRDIFGADFSFNWGNATTSLRWNHIFNEKLFLNTTVFYSNYDYALGTDVGDDVEEAFNWQSNIINYSIKPDFQYFLNTKNTITFGGQAIYYFFNPGQAIAISGGESRSIGIPDKFALESSAYIGNEQKLNNILSLQYGIRFSNYRYLGSGTAIQLDETGTPGERKEVIGSTTYKKGETIHQYNNWEPRFSANIALGSNSSLKLSYNRLAQYIHLLSNTTSSSPLDVWTPSSNNIKPQIANQVAIGYFKNFDDNMFESSVELYYKKMENQIDYVRNADLLLNPTVEADLLSGDGRAYGAEFYLKKNKGKFNGWLSYTLARTERKVEGLNNGNWFPARIDKRHNLNLVAIYDTGKRWNYSATFNLSSGTPATFPTNKYIWQGIALPHNYYDNRNNYRIPASHRLDLSATLQNKHAFFKRGKSEWVFSIYNVYNRRNPFSVYVRQNEDNYTQTEAVRYAVFGSILPAVTYNFNF